MTPTEEQLKTFKENWPDAVYAPWDPPPIGQRVRKLDYPRPRAGVVVGVVEPITQTRIHSQTCPTCQCSRVDGACAGWWRVQWEEWWAMPEGDAYSAIHSKEKPPAATGPMETADYPPSLVPVEATP